MQWSDRRLLNGEYAANRFVFIPVLHWMARRSHHIGELRRLIHPVTGGDDHLYFLQKFPKAIRGGQRIDRVYIVKDEVLTFPLDGREKIFEIFCSQSGSNRWRLLFFHRYQEESLTSLRPPGSSRIFGFRLQPPPITIDSPEFFESSLATASRVPQPRPIAHPLLRPLSVLRKHGRLNARN